MVQLNYLRIFNMQQMFCRILMIERCEKSSFYHSKTVIRIYPIPITRILSRRCHCSICYYIRLTSSAMEEESSLKPKLSSFLDSFICDICCS